MNVIEPWLIIGVFAVAFGYSMVGHGGASGYLALLAFTAIPSAVGATTALVLNVFVAGITLVVFGRAKHFDWNLAWPLLLGSIPFAFLGGSLKFENRAQDLVLAVVLLYAAGVLFFNGPAKDGECQQPVRPILVGSGAGIGFLSGLVGVGGGVFLSPLMVLNRWAQPHKVAALSAGFIFANSLAGLAARPFDLIRESMALWPLIAVGTVGAVGGSLLGAHRVSSLALRRTLGLVLLLAVVKLIQKGLEL
ncbi:MAG: sulfite exporter TauE/SafE family protein [Chthonomonas sp.]|nr:sulfite exporter TauE/SafE family protein [Chthonomonas sp.]